MLIDFAALICDTEFDKETKMRDTQPLEIITENAPENIGVIGATPGAGATFICRLLEREAEMRRKNLYAENRSAAPIVIVDMGENGDIEQFDRIIIVADCEGEIPESLLPALRALKNKNNKCAVLFNRCTDDFIIPPALEELKQEIPCFRIPFIKADSFTDFYNFTFYS